MTEEIETPCDELKNREFTDALRETVRKTKETGKEAGFSVCKKGEGIERRGVPHYPEYGYAPTEVEMGNEEDIKKIDCPEGKRWTRTGFVHSHPNNRNPLFSRRDMKSGVESAESPMCIVVARGDDFGKVKCKDFTSKKYTKLADKLYNLKEGKRTSKELDNLCKTCSFTFEVEK